MKWFSCKRKLILLIFILCFPAWVLLAASDALAEGKKLLSQKKPEEAIPLLYQAVSEEEEQSAELEQLEEAAQPEEPEESAKLKGKSVSKARLYLGIAYSALQKYTEAEQWLLSGKETGSPDTYLYAYNLGNVYFMQKRYEEAETAYTETLAARKNYAPAVLNRANTYMHQKKYPAALEDYKLYLNLEPASSQKRAIQRLLLLLVEEEFIRQINLMQEKTRKLAEKNAAEGQESTGGSSEIDVSQYETSLEEINAALQSIDEADSLPDGTLDLAEDSTIE